MLVPFGIHCISCHFYMAKYKECFLVPVSIRILPEIFNQNRSKMNFLNNIFGWLAHDNAKPDTLTFEIGTARQFPHTNSKWQE